MKEDEEDVLLLSEGTVLDNRYILKLRDFLKRQQKDLHVSVIEPSPLARIFYRD